MPVGAAIGAAGSLGAAGIGYLGSQAASKAQTGLGQQALSQQLGMFNTAQQGLQPYISAGQSVLPTLQNLLTPGPSQTQTLSQLPGFQFQSQWGNLATTNALAARGLGGSSGPLAMAISNYNQGLAGTAFSGLTGMLQNYASMGSGAASSLGGIASQTGAQAGGTLTGIGQAQAQGILGGTNALASGLTGTANAGSNAYLLSALLQNQGGAASGTANGSIYPSASFLNPNTAFNPTGG
jgi:hypothetical protein